jgi:hypothetical protein
MLTYDGSSEREATTDTHKLGRLRIERRLEKWLICGDFLRNACSPVGIPGNLYQTTKRSTHIINWSFSRRVSL